MEYKVVEVLLDIQILCVEIEGLSPVENEPIQSNLVQYLLELKKNHLIK